MVFDVFSVYVGDFWASVLVVVLEVFWTCFGASVLEQGFGQVGGGSWAVMGRAPRVVGSHGTDHHRVFGVGVFRMMKTHDEKKAFEKPPPHTQR